MSKMNEQNNPQWLDTLRNDVNHYESLPPTSEWTHLEASLDAQGTVPKKALWTIQSHWLRIVGSGAIAALLVLGFLLIYPASEGPAPIVQLPTEVSTAELIEPSTLLLVDSVSVNLSIRTNTVAQMMPSTETLTLAPLGEVTQITLLDEIPFVATEQTTIQPTKTTQVVVDSLLMLKRKRQREYLEQLEMENERIRVYNEQLEQSVSHLANKRFTIGLMADAGLMNQSNSVSGSTNQMMSLAVSDMNYESPTNEAKGLKLYNANNYAFIAQPSYSYHHKYPLNLGLSFAINVAPRLAFVTGLVYTKLSADVTDEIDHRTFGQTVHYLSIPIAIQWSLIEQRYYNIYLSAGTTVGRSIDAQIDEQSFSVHGVQTSFNTSLGAQYFLLPHWSIFTEVGYAKFYDDDKRIETYRDTHSTEITFSFGFRWHL